MSSRPPRATKTKPRPKTSEQKTPRRGPRAHAEPRPRAETSAETREALIRAGIELFAREGLDAPSLDAICARAGKTRGAFYVHFADRDAFLAAVMERVGLPFLDVVLGNDDTPPALITVVQRFLIAVASGEYPLTARDGVRPHQLLDACARSEAVRARYVALIEASIARLSAIVGRGQSEGSLRDDLRSEDVAAILLAAVVGAQTLMELQVGIDLAPAANALLRMVARPER